MRHQYGAGSRSATATFLGSDNAAPVQLVSSTLSSIFYGVKRSLRESLATSDSPIGTSDKNYHRQLIVGETPAEAQLNAFIYNAFDITIIPDNASYVNDEQICGEYENYTLLRFLFLTASSLIALFGTAANIFLFTLFSLQKFENTPPTLYPRVLALLDIIICTVYILLFGADAAVFYLHIKSLFILYHIYIVPAFVISRIAQIAIPYMLIFATLERFVWIAGNMQNRILRRMYSLHGRYVTVVTSLIICAALRLPTAWATHIYDYPRCDDFFRSKIAAAAPWVHDNLVYHVYDFHLLSIAQTVFPFFVLLAFNIVTVRQLSKMRVNTPPQENSSILLNSSDQLTQLESISSQNAPAQQCLITMRRNPNSRILMQKLSSSHRMNSPVKSAIITMVCIVASYLVSNTLHLILTVLERSNSDLLKNPTDPNLASTFHTTFSDMVSFVYMFTSAIRIAIYYTCNPTIRDDIDEYLENVKGMFRHNKSTPKDEIIM